MGNVITLEEELPYAQAVAVKGGLIEFVGSAADAQTLCGPDTEVVDYGEASIYPGFMEAHCHPITAGMIQCKDFYAPIKKELSLRENAEVVGCFAKEQPGRTLYRGMGFEVTDEMPTAALLDETASDETVILFSWDGHAIWMNTKAMEKFGIDEAFAAEFEPGLVPVDDAGKPTGYLVEAPAQIMMKNLLSDVDSEKHVMKCWEQFCFSMGYTACYDAGYEIASPNGCDLYRAIVDDGNFKLRTYSGSIIDEFCDDVPAAVAKIAADKDKYDSEYFKIIGVKMFADGVVENHTAVLSQPYEDMPGYCGKGRMVDFDSLVEMYAAAAQQDLNVHVHTIGDEAIKAHLNALEEVAHSGVSLEEMRPALAHLEVVDPADIDRFGQLGVNAVVAPLWTPKDGKDYLNEVRLLGEARAEREYPIKSFIDAGANIAFHTDFPVSPTISITRSVYTAVKRRRPDQGEEATRGAQEAIDRYQALCAMTKNVAYMWREEDRLGTIKAGKIANMAVFDSDFLKDDLDKVASSRHLSTIVDGEVVWAIEEMR